MKKCSLFLLSLLLLFSLCACGKKDVYEVERDGRVYTVDTVNGTVTVDGQVCRYRLTEESYGVSMNVTYPDGSKFWMREVGGVPMPGGSDDYDAERYASGKVLWEVVGADRLASRDENLKYGLLCLVIIAAGVFQTAAPQAACRLSHFWTIKDPELTRDGVMLYRMGGIVLTVLGAGLLAYLVTHS